METAAIIALLPYAPPFLFVDGIDEITEEGVKGHYRFKEDEPFYKGHFKDHPLTPGVILTECMAQIGLVCLGIYLLRNKKHLSDKAQIALTSQQADFYVPVYPGEKVRVVSEKELFRFNKLRCKVKMYNEKQELVARASISGMMKV